MLEVHGLNELAEIIEENERIKKAEREIRKNKIKELISEGISKEIAFVKAIDMLVNKATVK